VVFTLANNQGAAALPTPIPAAIGLLGASYHGQAWSLAGTGLFATAGLRVQIGF
jgi:hypothetical protein